MRTTSISTTITTTMTEVQSRYFLISGFVSQLCLALASYVYTIARGRIELNEETLGPLIFLVFASALIGILVGFLFTKIELYLPLPNRFAKGSVWFILFSSGLSLLTASRLSEIDWMFNIATNAVAGYFFVWYALRLEQSARSKSASEPDI